MTDTNTTSDANAVHDREIIASLRRGYSLTLADADYVAVRLNATTAPPLAAAPVVDDAIIEQAAISLWHRFADENETEWEDAHEPAVYRIAAREIITAALNPGVGVKPAECANGCPPFQVCDYCQGVGGKDVPAPSNEGKGGGVLRALLNRARSEYRDSDAAETVQAIDAARAVPPTDAAGGG